MPLELLKSIDDRDSRKEIQRLLQFFTVAERCEFLSWAVHRCNTLNNWHPSDVHYVRITSNTGEVGETFIDLCLLFSEYQLDQRIVLNELERRAGKKPLLERM